jgi:chromosome segregation ATPase
MTAEPRERHDDAARAARGRLAALQDSAAGAYAAITAAEAALRAAASRLVAAEQTVRRAAAVRAAARRAAEAHARSRPGLLSELSSGLRARSRWRRERALLAAAVADAARPLADARQALSQARAEFADHLGARGEAAAALRRLTAECAAARTELTARPPGGATGHQDSRAE